MEAKLNDHIKMYNDLVETLEYFNDNDEFILNAIKIEKEEINKIIFSNKLHFLIGINDKYSNLFKFTNNNLYDRNLLKVIMEYVKY